MLTRGLEDDALERAQRKPLRVFLPMSIGWGKTPLLDL